MCSLARRLGGGGAVESENSSVFGVGFGVGDEESGLRQISTYV